MSAATIESAAADADAARRRAGRSPNREPAFCMWSVNRFVPDGSEGPFDRP
jgi:hypothetical protein